MLELLSDVQLLPDKKGYGMCGTFLGAWLLRCTFLQQMSVAAFTLSE